MCHPRAETISALVLSSKLIREEVLGALQAAFQDLLKSVNEGEHLRAGMHGGLSLLQQQLPVENYRDIVHELADAHDPRTWSYKLEVLDNALATAMSLHTSTSTP